MKQNMDKSQTGQALGVVCALAASGLFGFSFLATKVAVSQAPVFSLLSWRFIMAFASMSLCAALGIFKIQLKGKSLWPLLFVSLFQPILYFLGETFGLTRISSSESGTIIACIPLITLLLMPILTKEQPTRRQWVSITISVLGVILVGATKGAAASFSLAGYLLVMLAAVSDAVFLNLTRRFSAYTGVERSYVMAGVGAVVFTAIALIENGLAGTLSTFFLLPFHNRAFLLGCLYLAVGCSVIAYILRNLAISRLGPGRAGSFAGATTLVSVLAGVLLLDEGFDLLQGLGTLLVLIGVYGANALPRAALSAEAVQPGALQPGTLQPEPVQPEAVEELTPPAADTAAETAES